MKRVIVVSLIIYLMIVFSGCHKAYLYVSQNEINTNYNNISAKNSNFWLTDDAAYFPGAPLYDISYYAVSADRCQKLYSARNAAFARVQAYDNMVYTLDWVNDTVYRLSSYCTDTKEHSILAYPENVRSYFAVGQHIYYMQGLEVNDSPMHSFYAYSVADGTEKEVSASVLQAGVMNDTPVYIVQNNNYFHLYGYDPMNGAAELWGSFSCDMTGDEYVADFVNFTSNQVILILRQDNEARLICYDITTGQIAENHMDCDVWSLIAYEDYAFMVTIDDPTKEMKNWINSIYRVDLHTGEKQKITQLQGIIDTYVTSDQYVFVMQSTENTTIYRYDCTGEKELVGKW